MSETSYILFLIVTTLVLSASGLVVGVLFSLPDAYRAWRYWQSQSDGPRSVYSWWRLVRTTIAVVSLAAFVGVAVTALAIPDPGDMTRQFLTRHLIVGVVAGLTTLVISEPVSERYLDAALEQAEKERGQDG